MIEREGTAHMHSHTSIKHFKLSDGQVSEVSSTHLENLSFDVLQSLCLDAPRREIDQAK
jgi:hypothetical protein